MMPALISPPAGPAGVQGRAVFLPSPFGFGVSGFDCNEASGFLSEATGVGLPPAGGV